MKRLVLIMGVQRSGTNALFKCLTSDGSVLGVNESPDSDFFVDVLLRPEPALRPHLLAHPGVVVLKPISETNRRSVSAVLEEFADYDVVVPWIYRDPVNCFHSHVERWEGFRGRPAEFAAHWSARNQSVVDALSDFDDRIALLRYEDLIVDPSVFHALSAFLGLSGSYLFRPDRGSGRAEQPAPVQALVDGGTAETLAALDELRRFRPAGSSVLDRAGHRLAGRLRRQWHKLGSSD